MKKTIQEIAIILCICLFSALMSFLTTAVWPSYFEILIVTILLSDKIKK